MWDLLDKVMLLVSRIMIYFSFTLFSLTCNQMHIPGLVNLGFVVGFGGFFTLSSTGNAYWETCILLLNLLLVYQIKKNIIIFYVVYMFMS